MNKVSNTGVPSFLARVAHGDATKEQARDTGMALVLGSLLIGIVRGQELYVGVAFVLHLITMTAPQLYRPVAVLWFGLSHLMGTIASKVLLSVIFFVVVTPIGVWRRMMGADPLKLRAFKAGKDSVMKTRNHLFVARDLEQPY